MYRIIGYIFVVLLIGTVAMAWSHQGSQKSADWMETVAPNTSRLSTHPVPVQGTDDIPLIYTNEK